MALALSGAKLNGRNADHKVAGVPAQMLREPTFKAQQLPRASLTDHS
jgi:hypothetical protein